MTNTPFHQANMVIWNGFETMKKNIVTILNPIVAVAEFQPPAPQDDITPSSATNDYYFITCQLQI